MWKPSELHHWLLLFSLPHQYNSRTMDAFSLTHFSTAAKVPITLDLFFTWLHTWRPTKVSFNGSISLHYKLLLSVYNLRFFSHKTSHSSTCVTNSIRSFTIGATSIIAEGYKKLSSDQLIICSGPTLYHSSSLLFFLYFFTILFSILEFSTNFITLMTVQEP